MAFVLLMAVVPLSFSQTVTQAVNHVLHDTRDASKIDHANVGIMITQMRNGHTLYRKNADHLYTPASVQKLFTAVSALSFLKPSYRFETGFYAVGHIKQGVLHGDLYIKFNGDPSLTTQVLAKMVAELRQVPIKQITGHVYIDDYCFNHTPYPPGWIWDDLSYSYAAPMDAIILNRNEFGMSFVPAKQIGQQPQVNTRLPAHAIRIENDMKTTSHYRKRCPITIYSNMKNEYRVSGCLDQHMGSQHRSLVMRNMAHYASLELASLLKQQHIVFKGHIILRELPHHAKVVVLHHSRPLRHILKHMLKHSDNLYTNAIFKTLGGQYYHQQGTWQNGLTAVESILGNTTTINFDHNLLADGAGLSRYNLITPHQLIKLLYYAYQTPSVYHALYAALPIAGVDGTLAGRMTAEYKKRRVHAKTGSMTGVTALSGYVKTKHYGVVAFAIMVNNFVGNRHPYIRLEDRLCETLARL